MLATATIADVPQKPRPESEKRTPLTARILNPLIDAMQRMADADDRTLSYMVEKAVREFVERHDSKPDDKRKR